MNPSEYGGQENNPGPEEGKNKNGCTDAGKDTEDYFGNIPEGNQDLGSGPGQKKGQETQAQLLDFPGGGSQDGPADQADEGGQRRPLACQRGNQSMAQPGSDQEAGKAHDQSGEAEAVKTAD